MERFLESENEETKKLAKRLKKYGDQLFTFVRSPPVKDQQHCRTCIETSGSQTKDLRWPPLLVGSEKACHPDVSVLATCKKRGESFMETVEGALKSQFTSEN